jgi:TetR/AcrR family transcriptional repressor of lmrAB and yxaGH operons
MVETTARLLWSQGLRATGMNQIVKESRAPRGSIYFHFPEGKEQLAAEALRAAGAVMTSNIRAALAARGAGAAVRRVVAGWEDLLVERLRGDGLPPRAARRLAVVTLSLLEGAMILCRARRSTAPLRDVAAHLAATLAAARPQ